MTALIGDHCVPVDAGHEVSRGISAADPALSARPLAARTTVPDDLTRPGHVVTAPLTEGKLP
jgi:3,4-dihydroxy 2-butanone 4-phosphate synthase/GTP cyclohydrolase II